MISQYSSNQDRSFQRNERTIQNINALLKELNELSSELTRLENELFGYRGNSDKIKTFTNDYELRYRVDEITSKVLRSVLYNNPRFINNIHKNYREFFANIYKNEMARLIEIIWGNDVDEFKIPKDGIIMRYISSNFKTSRFKEPFVISTDTENEEKLEYLIILVVICISLQQYTKTKLVDQIGKMEQYYSETKNSIGLGVAFKRNDIIVFIETELEKLAKVPSEETYNGPLCLDNFS